MGSLAANNGPARRALLPPVDNPTTLAHYLELLSGSGLVTGLEKFSGSTVHQLAKLGALW